MKKLLNILYVILVIQILCIVSTSAIAQFQQKPMLGEQIDRSHQLGDPVGFWLFSEGSGNKVKDLSGFGNTGILVNNVIWTAGKFGSALTFDANFSYVDIGKPPQLTFTENSTFTISCWFRTSKIDGAYHQIVACRTSNERYQINVDPSEKLNANMGDGIIAIGVISGQTVNDGIWHHGLYTYKAATKTIELYLDGVSQGTDSGALSGLNTASAKVTIGARSDTNEEFLGDLDNIIIWNRALSVREIALLYREPFCMFKKDDIALMAKVVEVPPAVVPTLYYYSRFAPLPLIFIAFYFMIGRKNAA